MDAEDALLGGVVVVRRLCLSSGFLPGVVVARWEGVCVYCVLWLACRSEFDTVVGTCASFLSLSRLRCRVCD